MHIEGGAAESDKRFRFLRAYFGSVEPKLLCIFDPKNMTFLYSQKYPKNILPQKFKLFGSTENL